MRGSKSRRVKYKPESFETEKTNEHFTRFYDSMLNSVAYKSLSNAARTVLTILKSQYKGGYTGDTVICPYRYLQQWGMNTRTIKNAVTDLEEKGFIKVTYGTKQSKGNLHRQPNEYKFIDEWKRYRKDGDGNTS